MQHSHEEIRQLVAAYVLGALPHDEEFLARAHILSCDECMAEAEGYQESVGSLSLAPDTAQPAPDLADRIFEAAVAEHSEAPEVRIPFRSRPTLRGAAAVMAVMLVLGGMSVALIQLNSRAQRDERIIIALLHNEDALHLRGEAGAVARILPTQSGGFLVTAGLENAPRNHVYQLWLMRNGEPESAGLFDGSSSISVIDVDVRLEDYEGAAVTIEPVGGSASPTTDPILATAG